MAAAEQATCNRCNAVCPAKGSYRDAGGRMICPSCAEALRSAGIEVRRAPDDPGPTDAESGTIPLAPEAATAVPEPVADSPPLSPASSPPSSPAPAETDIIPLADEPEAAPSSRHCANCGLPLGSNIICSSCGLNSRTGRLLGSDEPPAEPAPCRNCGYSMTGIATKRCPKCGTWNGPRSKRDKNREAAQEFTRGEYIRPVVMLGIGMSIVVLVQILAGEEMRLGAIYLLSYLIAIPAGMLAFFLLSVIWIGVDAPMGLTTLRLAGIFAIADALDSVLGQVCALVVLPIIGPWVVVLVVYVAMLAEMMDLELQDAVLAGLFTFLVRVGSILGVLYLMGVELGW